MTAARRTLKILLENNPGASKQEIRRLFLDAVTNDPEIAEVVVRELQDQMFAFDADRATEAIRMMVDNDPNAERVFASILQDMRAH
jgi:uncharacterized protein YneF (UPF0154 family)